MSAPARIAIIVDPALPIGLLANTVATIGIGLGAAMPAFGGRSLADRSGRSIQISADRPVPVLQAPPEALAKLLLKALPAPADASVVAFPAFARSLHAFEYYQSLFPTRDLAQEVIEGIGLAGPEAWLRSLTGSLKLLR